MRRLNWERFDGGLVTLEKVGMGKGALNMVRYGSNIRTRSGDIRPRAGIAIFKDFKKDTVVGGETIEALYEYSREYGTGGTIWYAIVFTFDDKVYYYDVAADAQAEIEPGFTLQDTDIYAAKVFDRLFFGNAKNELKVTDCNNIYDAGITKPAAIPTFVVNTPGPDWCNYKYTYYREAADLYNKESAASTQATATALLSGSVDVDVTYTQTSDSQVTHYKIYRTDVVTPPTVIPTDYYLVATIAIADAAAAGYTYNDTTDDVTGNTAYDTTDRTKPPKVKYLLWHEGYLYGAGIDTDPSIIAYSEAGKPFYWPVANWDNISPDDGDIITGLGAIGTTRFIFKEHSIYQWTGDPTVATPIIAVALTDATGNMNRLEIGCKDPRSLASWGNSLIFRAADGHIYQLTMNSITCLSQNFDDITNLDSASVAAIHDNYYIIHSGILTKVLDLNRGIDGWEGSDTNVNPNGFLVTHNNCCLGSEGDKIKRYYTGTQDSDEDFTKYFQPEYAKCGGSDIEAMARRLIIHGRNHSDDISVQLYNEDGWMEELGTLTYEDSDRWLSFVRGARGDFFAPRLSWDDTDLIIHEISLIYQTGMRH